MPDYPEVLLKLVILDRTLNNSRRVLVDTADAEYTLPEVMIPRFTRVAYSAMIAAREKYRLDLFNILAAPSKPESKDSLEVDDWILICRLQDASAMLPDHLAWQDEKLVPFGKTDRYALNVALEELELYESGAKASNFGKYSSFDELRSWYEPHLERLRVRETGIQQWTGDPWFTLFRISIEPRIARVGERVPETAKALWFKAVGEPNTREFAVTLALTREFPYLFPRIIASKPEWNGWLMEEVNGHELDDERDGRPWALTARALAKVQKRFIGREDELLALGCLDWRMPRVLQALDPLFEDMEEIMHRQSHEQPRKLDRSELRALKVRCQNLCHRVEDVDVPYTITHGDFSPHNVIVSNGWPILIDWAEAYVSFPFISWEYFWNRTIKDHPEHSDWYERMHRNYAYRVWASLLTARRIDEGLRLSPAMAVLIVALYGINDPEHRQNRRADGVRRSMVRRLHRELDILHRATAGLVGAL